MASALSMTSLVLAFGGSIVLLGASFGHIAKFHRLRAVLIAQRIVPYPLHRSVASGLIVMEFGVGVGIPATFLAPHSVFRMALGVEAAVYLAFLCYLTLLRINRLTAPCGCFEGEGPVGVPALVRAGIFAAGAGAAAIQTGQLGSAPESVPLVIISALVVAALARVLPARAAEPAVSRRN